MNILNELEYVCLVFGCNCKYNEVPPPPTPPHPNIVLSFLWAISKIVYIRNLKFTLLYISALVEGNRTQFASTRYNCIRV